jgi:lysophospholipase L1-like esterase
VNKNAAAAGVLAVVSKIATTASVTSRRAAACILVLALSLTPLAHAAEWVQTWGAAPLPPGPTMGPFPGTPQFENQTIRQTVRVSAGGQRIRIRFTNEYGTKPLTIGAARIALADEKGDIQAGSERPVLFSGKPSATVPAASPYLSDPIELPVKALSSVSISIYFPNATGPCTCHSTGLQDALVSDSGDYTATAFTPKQTLQQRLFISGVDVEVASQARAVVVLGDSISDGMGSTPNTNRRWPDLLAARLHEKGAHWGVVNMGISGNRVLSDGAGQSALARFDRDVLSVPGVKTVVIFEGVNDLGLSYGRFEGPMADVFKSMQPHSKATAESLIAGYRQLIARARAKGLNVLAATITPYDGAAYYSEEGEAVRQAVNEWIRTGKEVDGVLDFDAAIRDPAQPSRIKDGFHSGDFLHGSDAGYAAMAASIDLSLFE